MRNTIHHFGFVAFTLCCPLLCAEEARTWKDDTGLFSIEASLEQIDGDSIKLKKTDGTSITLPVSKLSEADRQYIANLSAQNPFGSGGNIAVPPAPANPFPNRRIPINPLRQQQTGTTVQPPKMNFISFTGLPVQAVDISQTPEADTRIPSDWAGKIDPAPPSAQPADVARLTFRMQDLPTMAASRRTDFFVAGNKALLAFHVTPSPANRASENNFTRICLGFTDTGNTMTHDSPLKLRPLGISPNGKRVLFLQDTWEFPPTGKRVLLHLAEITDQGWTAAAMFEPFAGLKRTDTPVNFDGEMYGATWADNEHILVQSDGGTLIFMNVDTGEAIWRVRTERHSDIALSSGRKYCFLLINGSAMLCETMTGKAVGSISDARLLKFRFSLDGKRFVACNDQGILLGDTATGKTEIPFYVSSNITPTQQHLFWLDDRYLFFGGDVVDTKSKTTVWTYTGLQSFGLLPGVKLVDGRCWCLFDKMRQGAFMTAITIPHKNMSAEELPADGTAELAIQQGSEVSVVLEDSIAKDRGDVRKSIETKITDNGWKISDSAAISIVLKIKEEKEDTTAYTASSSPFPFSPIPRPIPRMQGGGGVEVKFQPERYCLSIMQGEKEIWSKDHLTRPPSQLPLDVVKDSSLQEVIDKEMEQLNYKEWLEKQMIPKTIARKQESKGTSKVSENGIE